MAVHAWVLMTNHVHLLVTPDSAAAVSRLMQKLGRQYVGHFNHVHERSGTLWEGRFKACAVHADAYLLNCMRYIECNPVRAGIVDRPEAYFWSSFRGNALGEADPLVTPHPNYANLGNSPAERQRVYRECFRGLQDESELTAIREATGSGHLLASEHVRKGLERTLSLSLGPAVRGRPKRPVAA